MLVHPQGWRLDPLLLFCQLLTAGVAVVWALEALALRKLVEDDKVNFYCSRGWSCSGGVFALSGHYCCLMGVLTRFMIGMIGLICQMLAYLLCSWSLASTRVGSKAAA